MELNDSLPPLRIMKLIRPVDIVIILLVLIVGSISILQFRGGRGARAEVYIGNRKAAEFSLSGPVAQKQIPTRIGDVELRVGEGSIQVSRSPCTQKICILQGKIRHTHQQIICVPARMVIKIINPEASNSPQQIDAISY